MWAIWMKTVEVDEKVELDVKRSVTESSVLLFRQNRKKEPRSIMKSTGFTIIYLPVLL